LDTSKCKSILTWVKQRLTAIIRNYNRSGNGACNAAEKYQFIGDEEDKVEDTELIDDQEDGGKYGHFDLDQAMQEGGDDRKNFLDRLGYPPDVLYWWQVLQDLDILQATCAIFNRELGVSSIGNNESVATLDAKKREENKRKREDREKAETKKLRGDLKSLDKTVASMYALAVRQDKDERERKLRQDKDERKRKLSSLQDNELAVIEKRYSSAIVEAPQEVKDAYDCRLAQIRKEITELEAELEE
jgi:hypothetical protein